MQNIRISSYSCMQLKEVNWSSTWHDSMNPCNSRNTLRCWNQTQAWLQSTLFKHYRLIKCSQLNGFINKYWNFSGYNNRYCGAISESFCFINVWLEDPRKYFPLKYWPVLTSIFIYGMLDLLSSSPHLAQSDPGASSNFLRTPAGVKQYEQCHQHYLDVQKAVYFSPFLINLF